MIITNFNNEYLKITSDYLADFLANPGDYTSIEVSGNINCCTSNDEEIINEASIPAGNTGWYLNLSVPVGLDTLLQTLKVQNINTLSVFNVLTSPIDLSYISANCVTEDCTLETFSVYFTPLFKDAIDNWFATQAIASDVSVTFSGNTVIVDNLPANFTMYNAGYGSAEPYTEILFTYAEVANIFILADGIYILPEFFELTSLIDGIYKVTLKFVKDDNSYIQETNCSFIDVTIKCKVASILQDILKESKVSGSEKSSTIIHLLHYALVNGSNCGCNCEELCKVYTELVTLLDNIDSQIISNCDC